MSEQRPGGLQPSSNDTSARPPVTSGGSRRLGNPTRLVPRRTPPPVEAQPIEPDPLGFEPEPDPVMPTNTMREPYLDATPQDVGRPRFQVIGFPGCLIVSLIASVLLTVLLNIVF